MKKSRHLASNLLQSRTADSDVYYLILLEIGNFFEINFQYGFEEGERIVKEVTRILSASIREDDYFSHQGSGHYMIIIKNIRGNAIHAIGERLRNQLKEMNAVQCRPYKVSFSWGYARARMDSDFEQVCGSRS